MRVVILGAGGHGREIAEILRHQADRGANVLVLGFVDEDLSLQGRDRDGLPVLGDWTFFHGVDRRDVFVIPAVGSPTVCRKLVTAAKELGLSFASAVSPLAQVSPNALLGNGVALFPHVVVNTGATIGDHCTLNVGTSVSHDCRVGAYCNLNPGVRLAGDVTLGEGCYIGMGASIIQQRTVGPWAVVGAGGVVIDDLPGSVTAVGVPAKVVSHRGGGEK